MFKSRRRLVVVGAGLCLLAGAVHGQTKAAPPLVSIRPFHVGVCQLGKDHVLGLTHSATDRLPFVIYSFLVESTNRQRALIDLGPKTTDYCNRMFIRYGLFRDLGSNRPPAERFPDNMRQPYGNVFDQLRAQKIAPVDIGHIVFSHLHADHHGMDDAADGGGTESFTNAMMYVSAIGWDDNLRRRKDGHWNSYVDFAFADFLERASRAGRVRFADNATIFPGMRTLYLGGHSVCSQAVLLDTAAGLVIVASDDVYLYSLLEENVLPQIRTSPEKYRAALDRLVRLAMTERGIIIAMHDPVVWETYERAGKDWLTALKVVSDRAVHGYARRRGWE